jgi:hypothetical protein
MNITYTTKKLPGYVRQIVVRTEESRQRAALRAVHRAPSFNALKGTPVSAQDIADEKHLSRSKEYPNKGRAEAERRCEREAIRLARLERAHLSACEDFDAMKVAQEADAA